MAVIRRVTPPEWRVLRELRLRALESDPAAFSSRHAEVAARPSAWWRDWTARSAEGDQAIFLAWREGTPVGMAGTYLEAGRRFLFGMWVDPVGRREGVGGALVDAVAAFARDAGADELFLNVHADNHRARALYESRGYTFAGSDGDELCLRLPLR